MAACRGILRVTSTVEYAARVLAPMLHAFTARHPALRVRLETHTSQADLVRDRFDVAIRLGRHEHFRPALSRCLPRHLQRARRDGARPAREGRASPPASPGDLACLPQLGHSRLERIAEWTLTDRAGNEHAFRPATKPHIVVDNASVLSELARQGSGVALLPEWLVRDDLESGALVDALPAYRFPQQNVYALYVATRHVPQKVRAWVDFMKAQLQPVH